MSNLTVAIMAAGKGTRMNDPELPKVMVELRGEPMISHVVRSALALDVEKVVAIVGYRGELVSSHLIEEFQGESLEIVEQREQLGTAHAVAQAIPLLRGVGGDLLVLSGDVPMISSSTLQQLVSAHRAGKAGITMLTVELDNPHGYGRVVRGADGTVLEVVEQKDASREQESIREINSGIYLFDLPLLERLLPRVGNNNASGEYYLPDVISLAIAEGMRCNAYLTDKIQEIQGINTREQLMAAEAEWSA